MDSTCWFDGSLVDLKATGSAPDQHTTHDGFKEVPPCGTAPLSSDAAKWRSASRGSPGRIVLAKWKGQRMKQVTHTHTPPFQAFVSRMKPKLLQLPF